MKTENTLSQDAAILSLCYKLVNTAIAKSLPSIVSKAWHGEGDGNIRVVHETMKADIMSRSNAFHRHECLHDVMDYLEWFQQARSIRLNKSHQRGLQARMTISDYRDLDHFIYELSSPLRPTGRLQTGRFDLHEILRAVSNFLLVKQAIEHGTGLPGLDNAIQSLLSSKPEMFFKVGYLTDLFVCDWLLCAANSCRYILCRKDYLSTRTSNDDVVDPNLFATYHVFRVA